MQAPTQFFQTTTPAPPPPQSYPPAQGYAPPQPPQPRLAACAQRAAARRQPEQPVYTLPETVPSRGLPAWLVAFLVALLVIGGLFLAYKLLGGKSGTAPPR